ncbi:MAG: LamG-like jellyroll fold domain-containing protein [Verrucomicrobiota bacterium]
MLTNTRPICRPFVLIALFLAGMLVNRAVAQSPPATFTRVISTSSQSLPVDFALHPIRSTNFAVLVQQSDGSFSTFTPAVARTYLGTVQGRPGAIACGLLRADGALLARIGFEDGTTWTTTGGTASADGPGFTPAWPTTVVPAGGAGSIVYAAEYGFDSTFNHFTACGGTPAAVLEQIEFCAMSANMVYLRDAGILHRIGKVIVRADLSQDPYVATTVDTGLLLNRIGPIWNSGTPMGLTHDLAAVLHSGVGGGLAWVGAVGTSNRYSSNDSEANGDFSVVWRHEAGHNWGSDHYEGGGNPEGSTIMSNNSLSRFSSSELAKIIVHRNSKTAILDNLGTYSFPLPPRANQDAVPYLVTGTTKIDVLANDSDSNGQVLSLLSFDSVSAFGGTLSRSTGTGPGGRDEIIYTPPAVLTPGADWFTYRIQDASGMQAVGYAMLRPTSEVVTPVDHWTLDDASGTTAVNRIRTAQNGTHQNGAVVNQSGANAVTRKGVSFDGTDDQTSIPAPSYNTNTLTFTTWVKRNGDQADWAPLFFSRAGSSIAGLHFGTDNELRYTWDNGGYTWNSGITVPDNTWCLAVMCVSPTGTTLHLRTPTGLLSATNSGSLAAESFNGTMYLGYDSSSSLRHFKGWLDDVRVYKSTLTATQVESLYQETVNAPSVVFTAPTAGSSVSPLNVSLAASVNTLAAITSRVDFVENEASLASASAAPWTAQLASLAPGAHTLTARASYGDWGYQIDSAPVSFTALPAPLPVVTVTASLSASKRGPVPGSFTFTRSHPIGSITVPFALTGTAVPGTDYTAIPNNITFPDGSLSQTITVNPIAASPDGINETLTLTLASGSAYSLSSPSAATLTIDDHITSIASAEWDLGTTWNSGNPAPASGTQNAGDAYAVVHTVTSNDSASNTQALVAKSLRIQSGGVLDLARLHSSGGETVPYNLPSTAVENGGILQFRCSNGTSVHNVSAAVTFAGATTLKLTGGSYDDDVNLSGALTGSGTISVLSDTSAGGTYVRQVSVNSSNNTFAGNWTVNHTGGGTQSAALRANATKALGTGTVTVGTRAQLINDNSTGLNSLAGVVLNGTSATLQLNQPWTNSSASLSLTGGSPLVQLGNAASSIGDLLGQFGTIQGSGTSSSLTVNQTTDRVLFADLGTNLRFTKAGPASLTLAGSLNPSLAITLADGTLAFSNTFVISSLSQSGGSLRMSLPSSPASVPLTVSGNHVRTEGTISVDVTSIPQTGVPYTLVRYQGTLTGTPSVTINDSSGSGLVAAVSNGAGSNSAITVVFSTPQYTLTYLAGSGGAISGPAVQAVTQGNNGTAVTAVPDTGYHFVNWSDASTANPRTDTDVTANLTVTANFAINTYTLTYNAGANGTVGGPTPQTVNHGSSGTAVTAVPNSGYAFASWSDDSTANPRTDTNVTASLTVTANFTATGPGPLPEAWTTGTVGTVSAAVGATYSNGTYNVTGGGTNISGKNDSFYFASQPWSGDGTLTARVVSLQNTGSAAKAGVMIRESTATGSRSVFIGLTPTNGAQWVRRSNTGGNSSTTTSTGKAAPYWVRLSRSGNTFTSYISSNGLSWTQLASATISMANSYSLGLATCSGAGGTPNASVFDNVSVSNPAPAAPIEPAVSTAPASLPALGAFTLDEGTVSFAVTGDPNSKWLIQESTDFVNWKPLQTINLIDGSIQHNEADERGAKRFFRMQASP